MRVKSPFAQSLKQRLVQTEKERISGTLWETYASTLMATVLPLVRFNERRGTDTTGRMPSGEIGRLLFTSLIEMAIIRHRNPGDPQ